MNTSRLVKGVAVAILAALASVVAVAMPASAATVTVSVKVTNYSEATSYATLYAAPSAWIASYELERVGDWGDYDSVTQTVTFANVPTNKNVIVALESYGSSDLVNEYYVGSTHGFAYPLITPAAVGTSNVNLGPVTIPAPGKIAVNATAAINKDASTTLRKVNGEELWSLRPTTSGGVSTFTGLVPGKYVVVYGGNSNYLSKTVGTVTVKAGQTTAITNTPAKASKITGKVTTAKGKAIKGVQIYATGKNSYAYAKTDSKGKYTLAGLAAGTYKVTFGTPGESHAAGKYASKTVTVKGVKAGKSKSAGTVKLAVGATVSGSVKYAGSTARVIAVNSKGTTVAAVNLSKKKSYKLQGLPKGKYKVYVVETGAKKPKYGVASVTLKAGKTVKAKKISAKKATISLSGKITGPGAAKANVYVSGGVWGEATANAAGNYTVKGLVPGKYWVSAYASANGGVVEKAVKLTKSGKKNLVLPAVSSVKFTHGGKAIVGAQLEPFYSTTDSAGVAKLAWVSWYKGQQPRVYAHQALGYNTPFFFALNKTKVNSKADMVALKVTGIGGQ